jgi:phosphinothricin acetyltransferase
MALFDIRRAYRFTEHSVYAADEFTRSWKTAFGRNLFYWQKQGYHTMIGVIDVENEGSIAFHTKKYGFVVKQVLLENPVINLDRWLDSAVFLH